MNEKMSPELFSALRALRNDYALGVEVGKGVAINPKNKSAIPHELKQLGKLHGKSTEMIRRRWKVSQAFTQPQFDKLIEKCEKDGFAVSFAHLHLLVRVRPISERNQVQKQVIEERWTTRRLENFLRSRRKANQKQARSSLPRRRRGKLPKVLQREQIVGELESMISIWTRFLEEVPEKGDDIQVGKDELGAKCITKIEKLTKNLREISELVSEKIDNR